MKNKFIPIAIVFFFIFIFMVFLNGLKNSHIYVPKKLTQETFETFKSNDLFFGNEVISDDIFVKSEYYLVNIWASWCKPCKLEHHFLMKLKQNNSIKIIGLNYKDDLTNAKNFISKLGNPYSVNLIDKEGTISINFGAYGVPETFLINKDKIIIKRFIGPLDKNSLNEIYSILK